MLNAKDSIMNLVRYRKCFPCEKIFCEYILVRNKWADNRMRKDYDKRKLVEKYAPERLRINALRKNKILPKEIQEIADKEIQALPHYSTAICVVNRCCITSRPRGVPSAWRVSRFVWRHLADYNLMSGVQRAMW